MNRLMIYVHGQGGSAEEAEHYKTLFTGCDVEGVDYKAKTPWEANEEFASYLDSVSKGYDSVILIANSIGAFFSMSALSDKRIDLALLISPIVNMERLIMDMMMWAKVTEDELQRKKEIATEFGETLSWEYLSYVRKQPITWKIPTHILYGEKDNLTSMETMSEFAKSVGATITVMEGGEHWFHTAEQMEFLDAWIKKVMEE